MTEYVSCRTAADAEIVRDVIWQRVSAALVGVGVLSKGTWAFAVNGHSTDPGGGGPTADLAEWSAATQDARTGRHLVELPTAHGSIRRWASVRR